MYTHSVVQVDLFAISSFIFYSANSFITFLITRKCNFRVHIFAILPSLAEIIYSRINTRENM